MSTTTSKIEKGETDKSTNTKLQSTGSARRNRPTHTNATEDHTPRNNKRTTTRHHGNGVGGVVSGRDSLRNKTGNWESAHTRNRGNLKDSEQVKMKSRESHTRLKPHPQKQHTKNTGINTKPHPIDQSTKFEDECDKETLNDSEIWEESEEINHTPSLIDTNETTTTEERKGENSEMKTHRYMYNRDELLALKECTVSLLTPVGFENMEAEVVRDILKRHGSSSSSTDQLDNENESLSANNEDTNKPLKHPTTLTLLREHDTKSHAKVSLTPQRRSFGSGCSWRESPCKATPPSEQETEKDDVFHQASTHHHVPKVIDHIPYRSRSKGEWSETPPTSRRRVNSWREAPPPTVKEDEPEWMSFGPEDCNEVMELKGLEEHELEKEARSKCSDTLLETKQEDETSNHCPSPHEIIDDNSDSGLPSSSPLDEEEHEYMLDGFDFSTGVSICQNLASDSEEEEEPNLPSNANKQQLTTALLNVLNISSGGQGEGGVNKPFRAMTLDEIEEPHQQEGDHDQTAFNKLLAAINSPRGSEPHPRNEVNKVGVVNERPIFKEHEQYQSHRYQDTNRHYRSEIDQWTPPTSHWGTHPYQQPYKPHPPSMHIHQGPPPHSWVSEMEQRRRAELLVMEERQRAHLQQVQRSSSGPSIGFVPTAVIRQMHSKTLAASNQPSPIERTSIQSTPPIERDYPIMTPHYHPSLLPPHIRGGASPHLRPARGNVRQVDQVGGAVGGTTSYPPPHHHIQMMPPSYRIAYQQ